VAIWVLSPWLTGSAEPWDAELPIWQASWLVVGIAGSVLLRRQGYWLALGYALGQVLATIGKTL